MVLCRRARVVANRNDRCVGHLAPCLDQTTHRRIFGCFAKTGMTRPIADDDATDRGQSGEDDRVVPALAGMVATPVPRRCKRPQRFPKSSRWREPKSKITRPTEVMHQSRRGCVAALTLVTAVALGLLVSACSSAPLRDIGTGQRLRVSSLACPKTVPAGKRGTPWVPAVPRGLDGSARLVPLRAPARVVICAYIGPRSPAGKSGSALRTGDLSAVMNDLAWVPPTPARARRACPDYASITDGDYYLIGLSYPGATVWVAAPGNHCEGSSNGVFFSTANLSVLALSWYKAGGE